MGVPVAHPVCPPGRYHPRSLVGPYVLMFFKLKNRTRTRVKLFQHKIPHFVNILRSSLEYPPTLMCIVIVAAHKEEPYVLNDV